MIIEIGAVKTGQNDEIKVKIEQEKSANQEKTRDYTCQRCHCRKTKSII